MDKYIAIDRARCENNGYCMRVASTLLKPAADGGPRVVTQTLTADQEIVARQAVAACPMGALSLESRMG